MSEKRGNTGKLLYDFDVSSNLEVQVGEEWHRVGTRDFRSFNGARRVSDIPYNGPLYMFATNTKVTESNKPGLMFVDDVDPNSLCNKRISERD